MKCKEKMVLSTENSKTTKKDIPKQSKKLNSTSTTKKCVKKEPNEKILFSLVAKSSEDFNDSSDFVSPQNRRKRLKSEKTPAELSSATSKEPKKRTSQRSLSRSSPDRAPPSAIETSTGRRTRSTERKFQEAEKNGESYADNSDLPKSSPALPSISEAPVRGNSAPKPSRCNSLESRKQTFQSPKQNPQTPKLTKSKSGPTQKDEKPRRTPSKKTELVKSNVVSTSSTNKEDKATVEGKDKPPPKRRTSRSKSKSSESSDTLDTSGKSSPKVGTPSAKKVRRKKSDEDPLKTPSGKTAEPRKKAQKSPLQDSTQSKRVPRKSKVKKSDSSGNNDSSPMLSSATAKTSTPNRQLSPVGKESSSNSPVNANQNSTVKCPTCKNLIPEEGLGRHILMCLKNKYSAGAKSPPPVLSDRDQFLEDEILARQIHEDVNKDMLSSKESVGTEEINFCHVCQKDLRHMNSMWKTKHINQCIDETEKNAPKNKKSAATIRQQVPACPMCGKQFKTGAMRKCHLKKCAQELSVPPEKALKLIAEQEKDFKPSRPTTAATGSSSKTVRSSSSKLNKLPDEQMQMAMAMSSSLFEEQKKLNEQLTETVKNIHQGVNRELRKLKKSQKKAPESTPLLLTISKEDQLARNAQRVDSIISEPAHTVQMPRQFSRSSLSCRDIYQISENSNNSSSPPSFWSRSSLIHSSSDPHSFYVQSLMPPIQIDKVTVGSRLKPLSAIPGRVLDQEETASLSDNQPDTFPLTQTAVLLAEMAQCNEEEELEDEVTHEDSCIIEQTQGFYLSHETDETPGTRENPSLTVLSTDLCSLVNNPHLSDVELVSADGSCVFAHRLLLGVRCPQILSHTVSSENRMVIEMKDISHNSLLAFLRYVYAGREDFDKNMTADLLQLSRKFSLPHLASICEETLQALIDEACYTPSVESVAGDVPEPLEVGDNLLKKNEKIDPYGMEVDSNSEEPYKVDNHLEEGEDDEDEIHNSSMETDDILEGIEETASKMLHSSPKTSSPHDTAYLAECNDQELPKITKPIDVKFSPEKQNQREVPIPVCDAPTDCSISVIEEAAKVVDEMSPSSTDAQDVTYKNSKPTSLESIAELGAKDTTSEHNLSSQQVLVFPEDLKDEEFAALVSSDAESDKMPTSFMSAEYSDGRSDVDGGVSQSASSLSPEQGFTDVHSETVTREDENRSNNALSPMQCKVEENEVCKENSTNQISIPCAMSDYGFDDSNELFSESEDVQEELGNVKDFEVNSEKLTTEDPMKELMETSNDSICFLPENQLKICDKGMSTTALHLADTVCENMSTTALHLADTVCENTSSAAIHLTDTICENTSSIALHLADTVCENTSSMALHLADTVCENTSSMALHLADTVCENTSSMALHLADTVCENTSSMALHLADTVCENTSSTALHLADTVCENTSSMELHLADAVCKNNAGEDLERTSPVNPPQILLSNSPILNGGAASFHMADTILELSKTIKDNSAVSPLSETVLEGLLKAPSPMQEYVSKSCTVSSKDMKTFSPCSLSGRFDSANKKSPDSILEVESPTKLSTSPKFSFSTKFKSSPVVKNSLSPHEDMSDVITNPRQRRKRKSCDEELFPLPKRSQKRRLNVLDVDCGVSASGLKGCLPGTRFSEETESEFSSFKERSLVKSSVAVDSADSYLSSKSTVITSDLTRDSSDKTLNKNPAENLEEWMEIPDDNSHCDIDMSLPNSPNSVLDRNLDTFSRLSDDNSISEDKSVRCTRTRFSVDSDTEREFDSKNGASPNNNSGRNQDCLPTSSSVDLPKRKFKFKKLKNQDVSDRTTKSSISLESDSDVEADPQNSESLGADSLPRSSGSKTPDLPKKKFTFKRTQFRNQKSPEICASVSSSSPSVHHKSPKKKSPPIKYSSHLGSSSEDPLSDRVESDSEYHHPNVWDDFEDNGHMDDFVMLSSPAQQNTSLAERLGAEELDCKASSDSDSPRTPEVDDEVANNESFNASFINDFICSSSPIMSQTEDSPHQGNLQPSSYSSLSAVDAQPNSDLTSPQIKTPLIALRKKGLKALTVPSPFTPMPQYAQMTTPDLKKEMKKHGCKQMPRKKMLALLENIYRKTHEYETDSDLDHSFLSPKTQTDSRDIIGLQTRSKDSLFRRLNQRISPVAVKTASKKLGPNISQKDKSPAKSTAVSVEMPRSQSEFTNVIDTESEMCDAVGAYEESFMVNEEDIPCSQQPTSGSSDNLHDKLRELVQKCPEIYSKVLLYEPIDFDHLKKKISESKIKCSAQKLLSFLDNQCITFAMKKEKQHQGTWKPRVPRR